MNRNKFLLTLGAFTGGALLGSPLLADYNSLREQLRAIPDDESFWKLIRQQFLFPEDYAYLNTGGIGAVPALVLNKVKIAMDKLEVYPRPGHDHARWLEIKEKCTALLGTGCKKEEIAFTSTATEGINIIINGLQLGKGDEIITSTHEHPALHIPLLNQVKNNGVILKLFDPDTKSGYGNVDRIERLITKQTRLIFISHITCTTGQIFPIKELGDLARSENILFAVDGAQATGQMPLDLKEWNVDFYAFSGHKWILGPKRTGILFVREDKMDSIKPTTVGAYSDDGYNIRTNEINFHPTAQRYEYGTQNEALFYGLEAGTEFVLTIGLERIEQHNRKLAQKFYEGLKSIPGIKILSPEEEKYRSAMISFKSEKHDYREIASCLSEKQIRVRVVPEADLEGIRVSFHVYNNESEVEKILREIRNCIHT